MSPTDLSRYSIEQLLNETSEKWKSHVKDIQSLTSAVQKILSASLSEEQRHTLHIELGELSEAFALLQKQADHPELVLATTGTTSSGKSTLANFLIGEPVLPAAVQEMSAGLVRVKHSHKRRLTIPKTRGATWETGIWENPTASEVCQRLEVTMNAFRQAEDDDEEIEPVVFEIEWPIRLAERKKELGLPEGTQVTIIDLPGLKAVNDERNARVIRENIIDAFCLMAYNTEETDRVKQKTLLNQVVNQIMALSYAKEDEVQPEDLTQSNVSLLRRMLFLLNRVDAFYRHDNAVEQLEKFKGEVTNQLREKLEVALPGHEDVIDQIEFTQVCSLPALLAVEADRLWSKPEKQVEVLEKLDKSFQQIFPKEYFKTKRFPRDLADLTEDERRDFINKTLQYSYGNAFEVQLLRHITQNFFNVVLDVPFHHFSIASHQILRTLDTFLESYMIRTEQEAEKRKKLLEKAEVTLNKITKKTIDLINPIPKKLQHIGTSEQLLSTVRDVFTPIEERIGSKGLLLPIASFKQDITNHPRIDLQDYVYTVMMGEEPEETFLMVGLPQIGELRLALEELKNSPYGGFYKNGGRIKGKKAIQTVENTRSFVRAFSEALQALVNKAIENSTYLVQASFTECSRKLIEQIKDECRSTEDLQPFLGLLSVFDRDLFLPAPPHVTVKCDYEITTETVMQTRIIENNDDTVKRVWNWLSQKWCDEAAFVKEVRYKEIILDMPPLGEMLNDLTSWKFLEPAINDITIYVCDLANTFINQIEETLKKGIEEKNHAIEASVQEVTDDAQQKNTILAQYQDRIKSVDFALRQSRTRQHVRVVEKDHRLEENQKRSFPSQSHLPREVPAIELSSQKSVVFLAVSVRVKNIKKSDSVTMWFKQASCYWAGDEEAWQKLSRNLEKVGVRTQEPVCLEDVEQQEDNTDIIIVFRSTQWKEKSKLDTFLGIINVMRDSAPHPNEVNYYLYPRKINLLNQEFGFRKIC
ncbi:MAG: dynamin family protein [Acetobacter sp.]|nr:dynamin family protein [Acetobacter sp.]